MKMDGPWMNDPVPDNRYGYNGKELNEGFGLGWNDYGARWYDASVGRWWSVDPLADSYQEFSTYSYTINNPINLIDPTGMAPETIFENATTGEQVEVKDGIDKTIVVNSTDFDKAKEFASIDKVESTIDIIGDEWTQKDQQEYYDFYQSVNSYDEVSLANIVDYFFGGPDDGRVELPVGGPAGKAGGVVTNGIKNPIREILKLPRKLLNKPKKRGNAPTFKKDGKRVEIHHIDQDPAGPFKEMHPKMHRGKGYHGMRHPNRTSRIDHKDFKKAKKSYWSRVFDLWGD